MPDSPDLPIWNSILTGAAGLGAWAWKQLNDAVRSNGEQIAKTREELLRDYAPRQELVKRLDKIDEKLDHLMAMKTKESDR